MRARWTIGLGIFVAGLVAILVAFTGPARRASDAHAAQPPAGASSSHVSPRVGSAADAPPREGDLVAVRGSVRDATGGPIPHAGLSLRVVAARESPEARVEADDAGCFATLVARGQYVLRATSPGYAPDEAWIIATRDTDVDFALSPGAALRGKVVAHDGAAVAGATVVVDRRPAGSRAGARVMSTDAAGAFEAKELGPGDYDVVAAKGPLFGRLARPVTIRAADAVEGVVVEVSRAQAVAGHVRLSGGEPVAGARVSVRAAAGGDLGAAAVSGPDGAYRLEGVPAGDLVVRAQADGHDGVEAKVEVDDGKDEHGVDLVLGDDKDEATLSGRVVRADGTPAEGATVTAGDLVTAVDEGGAFVLARVRPGVVVVRASESPADGVPPNVAVVRLEVAAAVRLDGIELVLPRGMARISGVVVDARGQPLPGAAVGAVDEEDLDDTPSSLDAAIAAERDGTRATRSAADGTFSIAGLEEGTFVVWSTYAGLARVIVEDVASGTSTVRIRFAAPTRLAGVVVGPDGTPARSYRLLVRGENPDGSPTDPEAHVIESAGGEFDVRGLTPGTYSLLAQTSDARAAKLDGVVLADGEEKASLRLVTANGVGLEGRVLDAASRHAMAGVHVVLVGQIGSAYTDDSGVFRVAGLAADGNVRLYADVEDSTDYVYDARSVDLTLRQGKVVLGDIWMMRAPGTEPEGETGMTCENWDGRVMVAELRPGSPAEGAGLRVGDRVVVVETTPAGPFGDAAIDLMLRGSVGTSVSLTVSRGPYGPFRRVSIIRGR